MIKNYIRIAFRRLRNNKIYSFISLSSLTIGLLSCLLTLTFILDELSYDKFWQRKDDIYRIVSVHNKGEELDKEPSAFSNLGAALKDNFPEVESAGMVRKSGGDISTKHIRLHKDQDPMSMVVIEADSNVIQTLSLTYIEGRPQRVPEGHANLIVTESFAKKHFPEKDATGEIIYGISNYSNTERPYMITGVINDIPNNSYLHAEAIVRIDNSFPALQDDASGFYIEQLILLNPKTDIAVFTQKVNQWYRSYVKNASPTALNNLPQFEFQPIGDIYLNPLSPGQATSGNKTNIYIFGLTSFLLLLTACFNYVNLTMSKELKSRKDTSVLKVLGAERKSIFTQSVTETCLHFLFAAVLAFMLYRLTLPLIEQFFNYTFNVPLFGPNIIFAVLTGSLFLIGGLTALYPAMIASTVNPIKSLKGEITYTVSGNLNWVKKGLVVLQFTMATFVIIATISIWRQIDYVKQQRLGYNPENVLHIPAFRLSPNDQSFINELEALNGVNQVSKSAWYPTGFMGNRSRKVEDPYQAEGKVEVYYIEGDKNLASLLDFRLLKGRLLTQGDYHKPNQDDDNGLQNALLTESTAKRLGIENLGVPHQELGIIPVGIIADFHAVSLHKPIVPTVVTATDEIEVANVLIKSNNAEQKLLVSQVESLYKKFYPILPLQINRVTDLIQQQYKNEDKQQKLLIGFGLVTLCLAVLGIFGLAAYTNQQRVKEIGIRKVLGASISNIIWMLSISFLKLVLLAALLASPIAWFASNKWLAYFSYRVHEHWWPFLIATLISVIISFLTVGFLAGRTAKNNPVNSLRDE